MKKRDNPAYRLKRLSSVELSARINRFYATDFSAVDDSAAFQRVGRLADGYLTKPVKTVTNGVYRARLNHGNEPFREAHELWYPPAHVVKQGRFNKPEEQKFYVSDRANSAILEVRPKVGDFVTVLFAASFQAQAQFEVAQIGLDSYIGDRFEAASVSLQTDQGFLNQLRSLNIQNKWAKIDKVFCDFVSRPATVENSASLYRVTNAISELFRNAPASGLIYPSIETSRKALNLCLKTGDADELFFPAQSWLLEILDWRQSLNGAPISEVGYYQVAIRAQTGPIPLGGKLNWFTDVGALTPEHIEGAIRVVAELRKERANSMK